jgi:phosphoserine phosphatase
MTDRTIQRRIHLIRHGETNWNREKRAQGQQDSVLTDSGKQQAADLRNRLADFSFDAVYCSSSVRTRETAEILFADSGLDIHYCDELREIHMGPWEGQLYAQLRLSHADQFYAFWNQPDQFALDGAETYNDVQQRALQKLQRILDKDPARELAIVSHGVVIKTLLCDIEQRPLSRLWDAPSMHNCAHSIIDLYSDGSRRISVYADQTYHHDRNNYQ